MPAIRFCDSHMHTPLCGHAWGEPEEYAEQALKMGLGGIIITCHSPMPAGFWPHVRMSDREFDTYVALVERCRKAFAGQLDVRLGMETDYFPGHVDWAEKLHRRAPFHYVLGSVHWQAPEYRALYDQEGPTALYRSYWRHLADSAETGLFDCLAHPDLIKNFRAETYCLEDWEDDIVAALDRIAKTGVAMELNTSGVHKRYPEMNPGPTMLALMRERGIPVVLGSDSHKPGRVGEGFLDALASLQRAGYESVGVFTERRRDDLAISEVITTLAPVAA